MIKRNTARYSDDTSYILENKLALLNFYHIGTFSKVVAAKCDGIPTGRHYSRSGVPCFGVISLLDHKLLTGKKKPSKCM